MLRRAIGSRSARFLDVTTTVTSGLSTACPAVGTGVADRPGGRRDLTRLADLTTTTLIVGGNLAIARLPTSRVDDAGVHVHRRGRPGSGELRIGRTLTTDDAVS